MTACTIHDHAAGGTGTAGPAAPAVTPAARRGSARGAGWPAFALCVLLLAAVGGTSSARAAGASGASPMTIAVAGDTLRLFRVPASLAATLDRDRVPGPDSLPLVVPFLEQATGETLALGAPVLTVPLPGRAVEFLPPRDPSSPAYLLTRNGVVRFHPQAPAEKAQLLLPGWDMVSGTVRPDGTLLLLERCFDEQGQGALPAHLLRFDPARGDGLPDTAAVCSPGAMRILAAPGDTLMWITRFNGRTADRLALRAGEWRRSEVAIVPRAPWREERWNLRQGFVSPDRGVLVIDSGRGARPRVLEIDTWGGPTELYVWPRGIQILNSVLSADGRYLLANAVTNLSLLDLEWKKELSFALPLFVTSAALSADAGWVATAAQDREAPRSEIQIRRRGSPRAGEVWIEEAVYAIALFE